MTPLEAAVRSVQDQIDRVCIVTGDDAMTAMHRIADHLRQRMAELQRERYAFAAPPSPGSVTAAQEAREDAIDAEVLRQRAGERCQPLEEVLREMGIEKGGGL